MEIDLFVKQFEDALAVNVPGTLTSDTKFKDLPDWDSMSLLMVIELADSEYGKEITREEINKCTTIGDVFEVLKSK
jgi:acyl carrier protein